MEAKRMRLAPSMCQHTINTERLELKIWQNALLSKCIDDNYINRLLESTRAVIVASETLTVENEAINTAINTFGLKKNQFDVLDDSDDSNLPSTSSQSSSRQHSSSSTSSTETVNLECEAINSAISTYGLAKKDS